MLTPSTIVLSIIAAACMVYISKQEIDKSQEVFYKNISGDIEDAIEHVREIVNGRDEQRLIAILFRSIEDLALNTLNGEYVLKKKLTKCDWNNYNNKLYTCLASVEVEWYTNGVDQQLVDLFRMKNKKLYISHLKEMYKICKNDKLIISERRDIIANEFMRLIKDISDNYIDAFDSYKEVLAGKGSADFQLLRANISKDEIKRLIIELRQEGYLPCEFLNHLGNQNNHTV